MTPFLRQSCYVRLAIWLLSLCYPYFIYINNENLTSISTLSFSLVISVTLSVLLCFLSFYDKLLQDRSISMPEELKMKNNHHLPPHYFSVASHKGSHLHQAYKRWRLFITFFLIIFLLTLMMNRHIQNIKAIHHFPTGHVISVLPFMMAHHTYKSTQLLPLTSFFISMTPFSVRVDICITGTPSRSSWDTKARFSGKFCSSSSRVVTSTLLHATINGWNAHLLTCLLLRKQLTCDSRTKSIRSHHKSKRFQRCISLSCKKQVAVNIIQSMFW